MCKPRKTFAVLAAVFAASALAFSARAGQPLSERLPRDRTVLFMQTDLARLVPQLEQLVQFLDPDAAMQLRHNVGEIHAIMLEDAARNEFAPDIFHHLAELDLYVLVMARAEPKVVTHPGAGQPVPGEEQEHVFTEKKEYTFSIAVRAPSAELAANFLEQGKAMAEREGEPLRQIDVDRGELFYSEKQNSAMGRLGQYLVLSHDEPTDLWAALTAPAEDNLTRADAFQGLEGHLDRPPSGLAMVNLEALIAKFAQAREDAVAEAQKKVDAGQDADDFFGPQMQLAMAQQFLTLYQTMDRLFSLNQLEWAGGSFRLDTAERSATQNIQFLLSHGRPISPLLESILSGEGRFSPPPAAHEDSMTVLARLDLKDVYDKVLADLQASMPEAMMMFQMQMQQMKAEIGYDVSDLLGLLGSDINVNVRMARKEVEETTWGFDEDAGEFRRTVEKVEKQVPEVTLLWGLRDPGQARATLSGLAARLGEQPQANEFMAKRMFQEDDVYCVGMNVNDPDRYPDGMTSFALAVADRFLAFGSWERVTDTLRQFRSGRHEPDRHVLAAIQQHPDSNLLVVIPKAFQHSVHKMIEEEEEDQAETLLELLKGMQLPLQLDDPELDRRLKDSLARVGEAWKSLAEKMVEFGPEVSVIRGTRRGDFYEILSETELRK